MYWYLEVIRKYAVFAGRARRKEYWMFQLVNLTIVVILALAIALEISSTVYRRGNPFQSLFPLIILIAYTLATFIPALAVSVRRLHDADLSGWWLLISLVPLGGIVLLVFHVLDSSLGANQYGPNPKSFDAPADQYAAYRAQAMAQTAGGGTIPQSTAPAPQGFCTRCGTPLIIGNRFCTNCGTAAY
jgi:uncharacterized membrane protein YhaH (DUF805 family)